jgi:hypothetical protein
MQLGGISATITSPIETVNNSSFDFSPLEKRVITLEERQKYLMYALIILALYTILKK